MCAIRADLKLTLRYRGVTRLTVWWTVIGHASPTHHGQEEWFAGLGTCSALTGLVQSEVGWCPIIQWSDPALTLMIIGKRLEIKRPLDGESERGLRFDFRQMAPLCCLGEDANSLEVLVDTTCRDLRHVRKSVLAQVFLARPYPDASRTFCPRRCCCGRDFHRIRGAPHMAAADGRSKLVQPTYSVAARFYVEAY